MQVEGQYNKDRQGQLKTTQFTAKGISKMGADRYMFEYKPNRDAEPVEISVADHFRNNVKIPLANPSHPCVIVCFSIPPPTQSSPGVVVPLSRVPQRCCCGVR